MKQNFKPSKIVAATGATLTLGTLGATPATAALLDFNFTTINGQTGSFILNTSVQDSNPESGEGFFENAITNLEYPFFSINDSGSIDFSTFFNPPQTKEVVIFSSQDNANSFGFLELYLDYDNPDQLSDNSNDYFISQMGSFAGYGGFIQAANDGQGQAPFSRIVELTVKQQDEPTSVPEPSSVLGLGLLGMWSLKRILSSLPKA